MKNINSPLLKILNTRTGLVELIIVGFFIALGTNLIASSIIELGFLNPEKLTVIGLSIVLLSIFYLLYKYLNNRSFSNNITGSIVYAKEYNSLVNIPKYHFSNKLKDFFEYSFVENNDIKALWEKDKLSNLHKSLNYNFKEISSNSSVKLLKEATEYFILDRLSTHLNDYFNNKELESNTIKLNREDVSDIIIQNRFLDLFSKPMDERSGFFNENGREIAGDIVMQYSKGHFYNRFDLTLPKGSKIIRSEDSSVLIDNNRFTININVIFEGDSNLNIDPTYIKHVLGMDMNEYNQFSIKVNIDVKFKMLTYFSVLGWEYYKWIDSLLDELENKISSKRFSERIDWEGNEVLIEYINERILQESSPDRKVFMNQK